MANRTPAKPAKKFGLPVMATTDRVVAEDHMVQVDMAKVLAYRGNVPLKRFAAWVAATVIGAMLFGVLLVQVLVYQRQTQLVNETAARIALQAQSRAGVVAEWLRGMEKVVDSVAGAQLVRLYVAEVGMGSEVADPSMGEALRAQAPYMQQVLKDFVTRHGAEGAQLVAANGKVVASEGSVPATLSQEQTEAVQKVVREGKGVMISLRPGSDSVVLDMLRPVFQPSQEGTDTPVVGVVWISLPVGGELVKLVGETPLDSPGERTALLQDTPGGAVVVGRNALMPVGQALERLNVQAAAGTKKVGSVVDGLETFAVYTPVADSPFTVLQEYRAKDALALMRFYKPGLYTIVMLAVGVLAALMAVLTLHFMGQRNATRVRLLGQTMAALVRMVEARDANLEGHHARLARMVVKLGNEMDLPVGERATLFYAAQLSAVGRLLVPRALMNKKGKLSAAERKELEGYVAEAQSILGEIEIDLPVAAVIRQMYEREDGSGYPRGLSGGQIHRMAKVLGAADTFVALTSKRAHRADMRPAEALEVMADSHKFDKRVVNVLRKIGG